MKMELEKELITSSKLDELCSYAELRGLQSIWQLFACAGIVDATSSLHVARSSQSATRDAGSPAAPPTYQSLAALHTNTTPATTSHMAKLAKLRPSRLRAFWLGIALDETHHADTV